MSFHQTQSYTNPNSNADPTSDSNLNSKIESNIDSNSHSNVDSNPNSNLNPQYQTQMDLHSDPNALINSHPKNRPHSSHIYTIPRPYLKPLGADRDSLFFHWSNDIEVSQRFWYHYLLGTLCPCFFFEPFQRRRVKEALFFIFSFSFFVTFIQWFLFLLTCSFGTLPMENGMQWLLGPRPSDSALIRMGVKYAYAIKYKSQLWRLFMPLFLHHSVYPLVVSTLIHLCVLINLEKSWGIWKFCFVWFISGIGSILLSCILLPQLLSSGAFGVVLALMACEVVENEMRQISLTNQQQLAHWLMTTSVIILSILSSVSCNDWSAPGGGVFLGLVCGLLVFCGGLRRSATWRESSWGERMACLSCIGIGCFCLFGWFLGLGLIFHLHIHPKSLI